MKHTKSTSAQPLPFPDWVEQTYPQKTAAVKFLRAIGALDLAYLLYVMKTEKKQKTQVSEKKEAPAIVPAMPLKVEEITLEYATEIQEKKIKKTAVKKEKKEPAKKPATKTSKPKKIVKPTGKKDDELTIEFEHKPEPVKAHTQIQKEPELIEPEPLVLHDEPIVEEAKQPSNQTWIDDESLEDVDLRKSGQVLKTNGITVSFDVIDVDDEEETRLMVNGTAWRIMLPSPALNLSRMAQIVRVSYGELYVLGRMALGAMSGECYITAEEAARIVGELAAVTTDSTELDVTCFDKNKTSKSRKSSIVRIRFDRC